jgi:hypothetical protein
MAKSVAKAAKQQAKAATKAAKQAAKMPASYQDTFARVSADGVLNKKDVKALSNSTDARSSPGFVNEQLANYYYQNANPTAAFHKKAGKYTGLRIQNSDITYKPKSDKGKIGIGPDNWTPTFYGESRYTPGGTANNLPQVPPYEEPEEMDYMDDWEMPSFNFNMPSMPGVPDFQQATSQGPGSMVDGGATGFRRKRSSARTAGLTSKGTSQFKIGGQTARSSGLNIGV